MQLLFLLLNTETLYASSLYKQIVHSICWINELIIFLLDTITGNVYKMNQAPDARTELYFNFASDIQYVRMVK